MLRWGQKGKLGLISEVDCEIQQAAYKKSCLHPLSFTFSQAIFLGGCFSAGYSDLFLGKLVKSQPRQHSTGFQERFEISGLKLCHLFVLSRGPPSYALVRTVLRVLAVQFISFSALDASGGPILHLKCIQHGKDVSDLSTGAEICPSARPMSL